MTLAPVSFPDVLRAACKRFSGSLPNNATSAYLQQHNHFCFTRREVGYMGAVNSRLQISAMLP